MANYILPVVGSAGFYDLASPFDAEVLNNIQYTCKAIRRISDYVAANEDVKALVYDTYKLPATVYDEDLATDAYIVSLQSATGHWVYVPYRYVVSYPSPNGIRYRSLMIAISLPAIPITQSLDALEVDIRAMVESRLGVTVGIKKVVTSKTVLVPLEKHTVKQTERTMAMLGDSSLYATQERLQRENDILRQKVAALEDYIQKHP